ncbi:MAG: rhomboid family intramembrane serine protease [Planctomycetaceae bacterium]
MGLENRDYIRDPSYSRGFGYAPGGGYWAVKYLLIANILAFIGQQVIPESTRWFDLRQAVKVGAADVGFYERPVEDGEPPQRINVPLDDAREDRRLSAGSPVEPIGDARYGRYSLVRWEGRSGLVRTDALTVAPLRSWQLSWRLVTHGFCHGGFQHILFNMLVLFFFGRMIEPIYGSREFLLFFLCGVVIAGLGHVAFQIVIGRNIPAVGASGGVMAVVFLTAMIYPRQRVYVMFVIPVELRIVAVIYAVVDVVGALNPASATAHWAHLGGAAFGVAYRYYGWHIGGLWQSLRRKLRFPRFKSRPKVRVYRPQEPEDDIGERVDRLLEKISRHGESSLTDAEREFLADASRRYRKR